MGKVRKPVFLLLCISALILLLILIMQPLEVFHFQEYIAILFPKGVIAKEERNLLLVIQAIMLLVILPVYFLTFFFSWRYRATNSRERYNEEFVDSPLLECIWWGIPLFLTLVIVILSWTKTYELDPFQSLATDQKAKKIQVVALQWKWLFIYPEEKIASLNFLQIPKDTPIEFEITADAPMNSFWIPELGGQIYAMPKMKSKLHLIANEEGEFRGSSANLSGVGFSSMHFITKASSEEEYKKWIESAQASTKLLDHNAYTLLATPSVNDPPTLYRLQEEYLFEKIMMKFMHP